MYFKVSGRARGSLETGSNAMFMRHTRRQTCAHGHGV